MYQVENSQVQLEVQTTPPKEALASGSCFEGFFDNAKQVAWDFFGRLLAPQTTRGQTLNPNETLNPKPFGSRCRALQNLRSLCELPRRQRFVLADSEADFEVGGCSRRCNVAGYREDLWNVDITGISSLPRGQAGSAHVAR